MLKVGNGASVISIAIGFLNLHLSSGLVIILNNIYYACYLFCKNIISVSCLDIEGYNISI